MVKPPIKGIIPESETSEQPFFIESGDKNPQSVLGSFIPGDILSFSALINNTGIKDTWEVFFLSNTTNPNVPKEESNKVDVSVITGIPVDQMTYTVELFREFYPPLNSTSILSRKTSLLRSFFEVATR